jgi:hypothetical protein
VGHAVLNAVTHCPFRGSREKQISMPSPLLLIVDDHPNAQYIALPAAIMTRSIPPMLGDATVGLFLRV